MHQKIKVNESKNMVKTVDVPKNTRGKSPKFPAIGLNKAVEVVEWASKHGISFKRETFATFGSRRDTKGSAKSGAFIRRIAALKYFGLIEEKGGQIELTELTKRIIFPKDEAEKKKALIESFLGPELFKSLYEATSKNTSIRKGDLANIAVREYGITPQAKGDFISSFINSAEFAGLLNHSDNRESVILNGQEKNQGEDISQGQDMDVATEKTKEGWNIVVNEKDQNGNYELLFRSRGRFSESLWKDLNSFIAALEKEFQGKDLGDKKKDNKKDNKKD